MPYLPYSLRQGGQEVVLGHYSTFQVSGAIAATLGAAGHLARIRWAPTITAYLVLLRLRVGHSVITAVTTAVQVAYQAIIHRAYTTDHTTAITNLNMQTQNTNKLRATMGQSLMGTSGPGICTTAVISSNTSVADQAPFCGASFTNPSTTLGAAAVTNQVGAGVPMATLYERGADGFYPPVLSNQEGVIVQSTKAGGTDGTFNVYVEWTWAEVLVF